MADKALVYRVSFDGLDKQVDAIGKVDRELAALNQTVKKQRQDLALLESLNQKNTQAYADLTNGLGKNILQQRTLSKEKTDLIRATQNEAKVNNENEGSIVSLRAQLSNLTKEYNNLTKAERESAKGQDVQKQAKAVSDQLKTLESAIGDNRREVGNYRGALSTLETDLKQLIAQQQKLINSNKQNTKEFRDNEIALKRTEAEYKKMFILNQQVNNSFNQFNQQINNSSKTINNYGLSLKDAGAALLSSFGIGFGIGAAITGLVQLGRQIAETAKEVKSIEKTLTQSAQLTGDALDEATVKVRTLASTFDKDFNEILISATALSKQFGITTTESLDLIQEGFVKGADSNGEFLQTLKEYPAQFKAIGISAKQSIDIITQTANQGIYSDKGIDTIKEAGLALREQTQATQDALKNAFGAAFTDELLANINDGSVTLFEAIQSVSSELNKLEPQSKEVGAVIADVFKGAGEDAGLAYLVSLKDIGNETKILTAETKALIDEQERQLRVNEAQIRVSNAVSDGYTSVKNSIIEGLDERLTIIQSDLNYFEKIGLLLENGGIARTAYAKSIRLATDAQIELNKQLREEALTTNIDEIVLRITKLNEVVFSGKDAFGFAADAIDFYNRRLIELSNVSTDVSSDVITLEMLQKKLTAAQDEFNKTPINTAKFEKLRAEIEALKEQIESITNPTSKGSLNALSKQLSELNKQASSTNDIKKLQALQEEISKLETKIKSLQNLNENLSEDFLDPLPDPAELKAKVDADIAEIDRYAKELAKIKNETQIQFDEIVQDPIVTEEQLREQRALEIQSEVDKFQAIAEVTQQSLSQISQLKQIESDKEIQRIEREREAQIKAIEASTLTEEQKAQQIVDINKKQDAKLIAEKKKTAASQLKITLAQIAIDTARGIAAAVAAGAAAGPPPANLIAIATGIAAVLGGMIQAKAAISQRDKFAEGGLIPSEGGWIKGNSHANGGVKFAVGGRVMEAEGGEIIVNKNIQKRPDFVSAISQMNYLTGGKKFQTGGIVAPKFSAAGVSLASQQQVGQNFTLEVPAMQVLNNVVDTTDQQSSIIQIQNQTTIGG